MPTVRAPGLGASAVLRLGGSPNDLADALASVTLTQRDDRLEIVGSSDPTKKFKIEADTQGAGFSLTFDVGAQTASRSLIAPVLTGNRTLAVIDQAQAFLAAQTFRAASAIRSENAATQDAVVLAGRAGGTSSFGVTLQPATLTASRTQTLRDAAGNVCLDSVDNLFSVSQTIDRGTGALPAPLNSAAQCLTLANGAATASNIELFGYANTGGNIRGRSIGGTRASPTATPDLQFFFNLAGMGYDGVSVHAESPSIRGIADGLWSVSNRGGLITFIGIPNGSTTQAEWMRLQNAFLGIGVAPTSRLHIEGNAAITGAPSVGGNRAATLSLIDSNNNSGAGGILEFGGKTGQTFAAIKGAISDGSNNGLGHLDFFTRNANTDAAMTSRMRLMFDGGLVINALSKVGAEALRIAVGSTPATPGATDVLAGNGIIALGTSLSVGANRVINARKTGWGTATGTATRTTYDTTTVTLSQLAERVKALIDDLHSTAGHGLIGT